jgi:hypothetical protein
MSDAELQAEELTVLPQRLETIFISQVSNNHQSNFNNQIGGHCFKADCSQVNVQSNRAFVDQDVFQRFGRRW